MTSVRCGSAGTGLAAYKMGVLGGSLVSQPLQVRSGSAGLWSRSRMGWWGVRNGKEGARRVLVSQHVGESGQTLSDVLRGSWSRSSWCTVCIWGLSLGRRDSRASGRTMKGKGGGMIMWN